MTVPGSRPASSRPASPSSSTGLSSSIATLALGNAVPAVVSVISGPVLAQALDLEGRGQVAAAMAPFTLAVTLLTFGVPEAATYAVARNPHLARNVLRRSVVIMTLSGVAAAGAVLGLSGFLSGGDTAIQRLMVVAAAAIVPSLAIGSLRGVAQGRGRWRAVAFEKSLSSVVKLAVLVPLWLTGQLTPLIATILFSALPLLGALGDQRLVVGVHGIEDVF